MNQQRVFNFDTSDAPDGHAQWLVNRRVMATELARRMNLPLGHEVEVWLGGGVRLRGKLQLREEVLFVEEERARHLELIIDHTPFTYRDIESCVRTD